MVALEDLSLPTSPGLPQAPKCDFFNEAQWAVLMAFADAVVPSITAESKVTDEKVQRRMPDQEYQQVVQTNKGSVVESPGDESLFREYLDDRPSSNPAYLEHCRWMLSSVPASDRKQLGTALSLLATRYGSLILTGRITPVQEQPVHVREAILQSWRNSRLGTRRLLFKSFTQLAQSTWLTSSPLFGRVSGYPDVPRDRKTGDSFDFNFIQLEANPAEPAVIETDVVIVGSGCGGGVCAKVLAEAGHRVLVVDKGHYFPPSQLPMTQREGCHHMFENGGVVRSVDSSVNVVAGSCWGGGGTVNWSVALQTQGYVRREWADEHGLPFFATAEFQACLDRVCGFMGAGVDAMAQSHRGQALLDGARLMGWEARPAPQNTAGDPHACGHCHLGCSSAAKQGPAVSWLPAAAKAGAKFMEGFLVDKVTFEEGSGGKKATGVVGRWTSRDSDGALVGPLEQRTSRKVIIKAKKVIISAGTLWSPLILKKSGVKNRHIGQNLHLHPVNFLAACYDEETRPWEGGIITSLCTSFENLDNHGHGTKLEGTCMVPSIFLPNKTWRSGLDFKLTALRYRHMNGYISLTRDRDTGSVYPDPITGRPCIDYTPSAFDSGHTLEGIIALAKICYITGASEIHPFVAGVDPFIRKRPDPATKETKEAKEAKEAAPAAGATAATDDGNTDNKKDGESPAPALTPARAPVDLGTTDPDFTAWLARLRAKGNKAPDTPFASAHQMGTCRMSGHAGDGVVDSRGRVWDTENLLVADASVFPSASGVNPMVTNMAIADWIARGLARDLKEGK